ncbi:MAG: DNA primase small subunit domain-containing protein [Thermoplasmata archaeon]
MNELSGRVVQDLFKKYYATVDSFDIRRISNRELAFTAFGKQGMVRHTSFPDMRALVDYVRNNTPMHFYYSSAYYQNPEASMDNKRWTGADLVFDIDGDHIEGAEKMGYSEMLTAVKEELKKLLVLLTDDLSVDGKNLEIVFSGSRGYHVHVYSIFEGLESQERREIVDYISGRCISSGFKSTTKTRWDERINQVKEFLMEILDSQDRKWRQKIEKATGETTGSLGKREIKKGDYIDRNARLIAVKRFSSRIDEPVTIDIHRLIRTPGSLHGKSGLMVKVIPSEKLEAFNPLTDAIPQTFQDSYEIVVTKKFSIEFNDEKRELQEGKYELPAYSALFAVLKGSAEFTESSK